MNSNLLSILTDYHHADLFRSLQLLFEKRLNYNLFRPIGMEWYKKGFWAINNQEDTARQFLSLDQGFKPTDGTLPLNSVEEKDKNYYICHDLHNSCTHRAISYEEFCFMPIDIVIASVPTHIKPFKELARMKNAKFIFQMGNMFTEVLNNLHEIPNLLASTIPFQVPSTCNAVFYHQEFDTNIFRPSELLPPERLITSFINVYQKNGGFTDYMELKSSMPDFEFKSYGGQCQDGGISTTNEIAAIMQKSYFGFHSKKMGDGYGHVLYNWFACGKPIITRISDYKGKLGEELLEDDTTCIDLDRHDIMETAEIIRNMIPEKYQFMCQQSYSRFLSKVDFNSEEIKIKEFLQNLK